MAERVTDPRIFDWNLLMKASQIIASTAIATLLTASLAACSSDEATPEPTQSQTQTEEAPEATEEPTEEASEEPTEEPSEETTEEAAEEPAEGSGDAKAAEWAKEITVSGDLLTTIDGGDFSVDVYQVGVESSPKTGNFVDPDTNKPLIDKGDEVVYLNYIFTNTGSTEIPLAFNLVDVQARYADWKWAQGMDSITDSSIEEKLGLSSSAFALGVGDAPFIWLPGAQFSQGTNFKYQAGSELNFKVTLTEASADGKLDHDKKTVVEASTTIK